MRSVWWKTGGHSDNWAEREGAVLAAACLLSVLVICAFPIGRLAWSAFGVLADPEHALALLGSRTVFRATANTLSVAVLSTLLALAVGLTFALCLSTMRLRFPRALAFLFVLSLMISPQVSALAFKTLAGPASPLLNTFGIAPPPGTPNPMLGLDGIVLVMGLQHAPLIAITYAAGLARVPFALVDAARLDGSSSLQIVRHIILPVTRTHLLAATLLGFVAGVGNFGIPALLGLPVGFITLPTLIYREIASFGRGGIEDAALVSLIIAFIAGTAVAASAWLVSRRTVRLDAGGSMEPFVDKGVTTATTEAMWWVFLLATVVVPMVSLLATSLVPAYGMVLRWETVTLSQFTEVLWRQSMVQRAFANSLVFAGVAAVLLACLSMALAYSLDRRLRRFRGAVLVLVELPFALPGVVIAIACILLFVRPLPLIGISIYGTATIIIFAYLASFLAIAIKPVMAAIMGLDDEIEQAALLDAASITQRLGLIILPLLFPAVLAGAWMVFLLAFNELTISALLWSAGTETVGVALLNLEDAGLGAEAAALAVLATGIVVLLMMMLEAAAKWFPNNALPWRVLCPANT